MANEQLKDNTRRMYDAFNRGDSAAIERMVSPDFVEHEPLAPGYTSDRAGLVKYMKDLKIAVPDVHFEPEEISVDGDRVWTRGTVSGTQHGDFMGIPATGKKFLVEFFDETRYDRNVILEHWGQFDMIGLLQQLGVLQQMPGSQAH